MALAVLQAKQSFAKACESITKTKGDVLSVSLNPEVKLVGQRGLASYLVFARGEVYKGDDMRLEIGIIDLNSTELISYDHGFTYDVLKFELVKGLCGRILKDVIIPILKPLGPQMAIVGITVKTRAPVRTFSNKAEKVYFIRVNEGENLDAQDNCIQSNYVKDDQIYLLNAKPGRYAAVACFDKTITVRPPKPKSAKKASAFPTDEEPKEDITLYTTFFPKELIKLTEVEVPPGTIVFMGEYVVDQSLGIKSGDSAQLHYLQLIEPGAETGFLSSMFYKLISNQQQVYYKGSLYGGIKRDKQFEIPFLSNTLKHLKDTGWMSMIQKRLEDLKSTQ